MILQGSCGFLEVLVIEIMRKRNVMKINKELPPGQKESGIFPRFGLPPYANRFPTQVDKVAFTIGGDLDEVEIYSQLSRLPRTDQKSDFHCVTTWSKLGLQWSGYTFKDFYSELIKPKVSDEIEFVVLKAQDGYKTSLPLSDLLNDNVLLADQLDGQPLTIEHGAPVRIVAPEHYGYKNIKHLGRIEFYSKPKHIKKGLSRFMDHPRARVAHEERARTGPAMLFRLLYKVGIQSTIRDFEKALVEYRLKSNRDARS